MGSLGTINQFRTASADLEARLTPVETTADSGDDHLNTEEGEHGRKYLAATVVNGVYPDDMDGGECGGRGMSYTTLRMFMRSAYVSCCSTQAGSSRLDQGAQGEMEGDSRST